MRYLPATHVNLPVTNQVEDSCQFQLCGPEYSHEFTGAEARPRWESFSGFFKTSVRWAFLLKPSIKEKSRQLFFLSAAYVFFCHKWRLMTFSPPDFPPSISLFLLLKVPQRRCFASYFLCLFFTSKDISCDQFQSFCPFPLQTLMGV